MSNTIRVIHDFDSPFPSGRQALGTGLKLIVYAISKKLPFVRPLAKDIYQDCYRYCLTLAKLDRTIGLKSAFGLRQEVEDEFPSLRKELEAMGFSVHRHVHHSETEVTWDPPLDVAPKYWHFDRLYAGGDIRPTKDTEWAVFHADYPDLMGHYIDFLDESISKGLLSTCRAEKLTGEPASDEAT